MNESVTFFSRTNLFTTVLCMCVFILIFAYNSSNTVINTVRRVLKRKENIENFFLEPGLTVSPEQADQIAIQTIPENTEANDLDLMDEINIKIIEQFIQFIPTVYPEFLLNSDCFENETALKDNYVTRLLNGFIKLKALQKTYYGSFQTICRSTNKVLIDEFKAKGVDYNGFCQMMTYLDKSTNSADSDFLDKDRYKSMTIIEFNMYMDLYYDYYFFRRFSPIRLNKIRHILFRLIPNLLKNNLILPRRQTSGYIDEEKAKTNNDTESLLDLKTYDYILKYTKIPEEQDLQSFKNSYSLPDNIFHDIKSHTSCANNYYKEVKHILEITKLENYTIELEEQREIDNKKKLIYEHKKGRMLYSTNEPELS